jgi:hypothetical protein
MTMVEQIARGLSAYIGCRWEDVPDKDAALNAGRVALKCMREPTDAMLAAGREADAGLLHNAASTWKAMIDAALREEQ